MSEAVTCDERITANCLARVIIGLLGVVARIGPAVLSEIGAQGLPELACLAGAISYAVAGVYGRHFLVPLALVAASPALAVPGWPTRAPFSESAPSRRRSPTSSTSASWRRGGRTGCLSPS